MSTRRNWAEDDSSDDDDEPPPPQPSPKVEEKKPETVPSPASAVRSPPSPNLNPNYNMLPNRGGIGYNNMDRDRGGPSMNYSPNPQGPPRGRGPPPSYVGNPSNFPPRVPNDGRMNPNWNNQINIGYGMARGPPQMGPGPMGPMDRPQNGDPRYARGDVRGDYRGDTRGDARGDYTRGDARGDYTRGDVRGDVRGDYTRGDARGDYRGDARGDARGDVRGDARQNIPVALSASNTEDETMRGIELARRERELLLNKNKKGPDEQNDEARRSVGNETGPTPPFLNSSPNLPGPNVNPNMRPINNSSPRPFPTGSPQGNFSPHHNPPFGQRSQSDSEDRWSRAKLTPPNPSPNTKIISSPIVKNDNDDPNSNSNAIKALIGPDQSSPKASTSTPSKKDEPWKRSSSTNSSSQDNGSPNARQSNPIPEVVKIMARPTAGVTSTNDPAVDSTSNGNTNSSDSTIALTKKSPHSQKHDKVSDRIHDELEQKYEQARALRKKDKLERGPRTKGVLYRYNEKGEIERVFEPESNKEGTGTGRFGAESTTPSKTIMKKSTAKTN